MQTSGIVGGVLFLIAIALIFTSGGNQMTMAVGGALVFVAGLAMLLLGGKQTAKAAA